MELLGREIHFLMELRNPMSVCGAPTQEWYENRTKEGRSKRKERKERKREREGRRGKKRGREEEKNVSCKALDSLVIQADR